MTQEGRDVGPRSWEDVAWANALAGSCALALAMLLLLADLTFGGPAARAQQSGAFPPWPILYSGEVYLDGERLSGTAELTVRVGDWESRPVPVVNGRFTCADPCLIAGPPDSTYVGKPVTFHLDGRYEADYTFEFPRLPQPTSQEITLRFESANGPALALEDDGAEGGAPSVVWAAALGVIAAGGLAGGGWLAMRRRARAVSDVRQGTRRAASKRRR